MKEGGEENSKGSKRSNESAISFIGRSAGAVQTESTIVPLLVCAVMAYDRLVWMRAKHAVREVFRGDPRDTSERIRTSLSPARWCLDRAKIRGSTLTIGGWTVSINSQSFAFTVNGRPCSELLTLQRPDVVALFSPIPGTICAGFEAHIILTPEEIGGIAPIEVQCVDPRTMLPFHDQSAAFVPVASAEQWPLPDAARMKRVHGGTDAESFTLIGYSSVVTLDRILSRVRGWGFDGSAAILDWGCGCGRLFRYLIPRATKTLIGADVDSDNIAWCRTNLPRGTFETIPLHPPTILPAAEFDTIVGISIFTHLTEKAQDEWLQELRRIAQPGATLLMSVHGPVATAMGLGQERWHKLESRGFVDGQSSDLDEVVRDRSYYRNSFHSHAYIRERWSRYFEVVEIIPACIGNIQDLVVLKR